MATGSAGERMAFVIDTEAHLDGIRAARSEIAGIGTATDALSARLSQMSETSRGAFRQLSASEQKAVAGFIGVKQGAEQTRAALDGATAAATRTGAAMGSMANPAFAAAAKRTAAENANLGETYRTISPKARSAANAISMLTLQMASGGGSAQSMAIAAGTLTSSLATMSRSAAIAASASGIGALIVVAATVIPLLMRLRDASEEVSGSFSRTIGLADEASAAAFEALAHKRLDAATQAYADASGGLGTLNDIGGFGEKAARKKAMEEAEKDLQAATERKLAAERSGRERSREAARTAAEEAVRERQKVNDLYFTLTNERILSGMRGSGRAEGADIEQANIDRVNRDLEINRLKISEDEKTDLRTRSMDLREARVTEIQNKYADDRIKKSDEEARKTEEIEKRKAAKRLEIAKQNVHAIVTTEGSVLQTMKRLALEPIVSRLEGIAAAQFVEALASWPNPAAMAAHGLAAAAATAAAREVAGWAGGGSRSGGGAASAGGAGSGSSFEPRGSTEGQGSVTIQLYSQNPYSTEMIQQVKYELARADVLKRPGVQIAPTTGLRAG